MYRARITREFLTNEMPSPISENTDFVVLLSPTNAGISRREKNTVAAQTR